MRSVRRSRTNFVSVRKIPEFHFKQLVNRAGLARFCDSGKRKLGVLTLPKAVRSFRPGRLQRWRGKGASPTDQRLRTGVRSLYTTVIASFPPNEKSCKHPDPTSFIRVSPRSIFACSRLHFVAYHAWPQRLLFFLSFEGFSSLYSHHSLGIHLSRHGIFHRGDDPWLPE